MHGYNILFVSLSLAFCWVNYVNTLLRAVLLRQRINPFAYKPFTCVKCMCGWFALVLGCCTHGMQGIFFLPAGVFTGAMFEALCMRWL